MKTVSIAPMERVLQSVIREAENELKKIIK